MSVKSILGHFWKNWNEWNSNPGARHDDGPPSWWTMHLEVDQKYYLRQEEEDGLVHPVLDSLDNYKMLSERMNVLTIYLPCRNWSSVLTSSERESAVCILYMYMWIFFSEGGGSDPSRWFLGYLANLNETHRDWNISSVLQVEFSKKHVCNLNQTEWKGKKPIEKMDNFPCNLSLQNVGLAALGINW